MEVVTLSDTYQDSVKLMRVANQAQDHFGLEEAVAMMGTQENKRLLRDMGSFQSADLDAFQPDDLILAVDDADQGTANEALEWMEAEISGSQDRQDAEDARDRPAKSLYGALDRHPDANLELISIPSEYAAREAWKALHEGLHVHVFSDNVSLEHERRLKAYGREHDQLVMGPDCGTAIINQVPLGFANDVDAGSIGVVSAAGSGLQEVTSLIDRAGAGISQAIGTGGRDLNDAVGGLTMNHGIDRLSDDPETDVIVLVSKPPDSETMDDLLDRVEACSKPVVVEFIGSNPDPIEAAGAIPATTLADAARESINAHPDHSGTVSFDDGVTAFTAPDTSQELLADRTEPNPSRDAVRGLFSGGTLCSEAAVTLQTDLPTLETNVGIGSPISDASTPTGHAIVDLGADEFTQGRPHPMIDSSIRDDQLHDALTDDDVAIVLLDVILGYAAHDDPATPIVEVIESVDPGDWPVVIASVVGTRSDPQDWERQINMLVEAGVTVCESNAAAATLTRKLTAAVGGSGGDHA